MTLTFLLGIISSVEFWTGVVVTTLAFTLGDLWLFQTSIS